jgi:isochorismate pyruvate lyase
VDLKIIRQKIDGLDSEIVRLLAMRSSLVSAAGKLKKDEQGVRDPKRAMQVIENVRIKAAASDLDPAIAEKIYRTIIDCFVTAELGGLKSAQDDNSSNLQ